MLLIGSSTFSVAGFKQIDITVYGITSLPVIPCLRVPATMSATALLFLQDFFFHCVILDDNSTIVISHVKYTVFSKLQKCKVFIFASVK